MPYIRAASANAALAVDRAGRLLSTIPPVWLAGGAKSQGVTALLDCLSSVARTMQGSHKKVCVMVYIFTAQQMPVVSAYVQC